MEQIGIESVFKTEAFASGLNKYTSGLSKAASQTFLTGSAIANAIGGAVMAGAAGFVALGAAAVSAGGIVAGAMAKLVFDAAGMADQYSQLSGVTGLSTTRLQELDYAGKLLDVDLGTITSGLKFLTRNMYSAREGTGEQAEAFKALGINVLDSSGKLRDADIIFGEAIDALGKIKNPTEADAIAMKIMGRSAMELNPLIKAGSKALAQYSQEAHDMGAVVSEDGIAALDLFRDRMDALKLSAKGIAASLALNFLPAFLDAESAIRDFTSELSKVKSPDDFLAFGGKWMTKLSDGMTKGLALFKKNMPTIVKKITGFLTTSLPMVANFGGTLVSTILQGIGAALPVIIPAGLEIIKTIGKALVDNWPALKQAGMDLLAGLGDGIKAGWASIQPNLPTGGEILTWIFAKAADLSLAFKNWVAGVKWSELSQKVADAINGVDWAGLGSKLATTAKNIGTAIKLALFGGTIIDENGQKQIVNGIDWLALGVAMGTAFDDAVIGALHTGLNLGDVTNLAEFQAEWVNIGTQYGKLAGEGMAPTFWKEFWSELWNELSSSELLLKIGEIEYDIIVSISEKIILMWANMLTGLVKQINVFLVQINDVLKKIRVGPIPLIPLDTFVRPATTEGISGATPSVPVPNIQTGPHNPGSVRGAAVQSKTYSIIVNNPSAEPASTSVDLTLRKLNYLGAT